MIFLGLGLLIDYDKSRCDSYDKDSVGRRDKLREDPRANFFEKVCFKGGMSKIKSGKQLSLSALKEIYPVFIFNLSFVSLAVTNFQQTCGDRLWAFERVVGAFLEGFDDKEERSVQSKTDCEKMCLMETEFVCRYVTHVSEEKTVVHIAPFLMH